MLFYVWKDARIYDHWNSSLVMHVNYVGPIYPKHRIFHPFFPSCILLSVHCQWATAVGCNLTLCITRWRATLFVLFVYSRNEWRAWKVRATIVGPSVEGILPSIKSCKPPVASLFLPSQWGPMLREQFLRNSCYFVKGQWKAWLGAFSHLQLAQSFISRVPLWEVPGSFFRDINKF